MNERIAGGRPVAWEDAGRQIAPILGAYAAVVVSSSDPVVAAHVALGIARAETTRRRVVLGDLVGDLAPLQSLLVDDDPHGISDSILYGVSFNKIGRPVEGTANLLVMPSGTEPVMTAEIFGSSRWKRMGAAYAEAGALLLLVAKSDSPGLGELIDQLDGAVVVRDSSLPGAPSALILARVMSPTKTLKVPFLRDVDITPLHTHRRPIAVAGGAAILLVLLTGGVMFLRGRPDSESSVAATRSTSIAAAVPSAPVDSLLAAPPVNPSESASAAAFAVELLVANTPEGANFVLRRDNASLPSATLAPTPIGPERTTWYKVIAGAYTRRDEADSLLRALRASKVLNDSAGGILRLPLALLVDSVGSQGGIDEAVAGAVRKYTAQRLPVYALMQPDGGAMLYAGAFDSAANAGELLKTLREAGLRPALAYRTGRAP
ncbi:MAG TPA: hypothetical protein VNO75_03500 [Gemmatimonadaceae bacterium]|nr:hypothetical protein [Gemmatimonadaceae bacterium]